MLCMVSGSQETAWGHSHIENYNQNILPRIGRYVKIYNQGSFKQKLVPN